MHCLEEGVKEFGNSCDKAHQAFQRTWPAINASLSSDHAATCTPYQFGKPQQPLGFLLQVAVGQEHQISTGVRNACRNCLVAAEVARQIRHADMVIEFRELNCTVRGIVGRSVVHRDYFVIVSQSERGRGQRDICSFAGNTARSNRPLHGSAAHSGGLIRSK